MFSDELNSALERLGANAASAQDIEFVKLLSLQVPFDSPNQHLILILLIVLNLHH